MLPLPETNSKFARMEIGRPPKGDLSNPTIDFKGRAVSFRRVEGNVRKPVGKI